MLVAWVRGLVDRHVPHSGVHITGRSEVNGVGDNLPILVVSKVVKENHEAPCGDPEYLSPG